MKTFTKSFLAIAVLSLSGAGFAFAADKAESKVAGCCAKATTAGNTCTHACCVEAAKAGNNCAKCGGAGKIAKTAAPKK